MVTICKITKSYPLLKEVNELYKHSFPKSERDPINHFIYKNAQGHDFIAFEENNKLIGFAYLLSYRKITHILYIATSVELRGKGYGHLMLSLIESWKHGNTILVDVESLDESSKNLEERIKRIGFYKSAGYKESDICYIWNHNKFIIMVYGNRISHYEFTKFWKHFEYDEDLKDEVLLYSKLTKNV